MSGSSRRVAIAIDGPAGAGKSTIAQRLARLGFTYIDTGAMYRAVALWARRQNVEPDDMHRMEQLAVAASIELEPASARVLLNGEDVTEAIRTPEIGEAASASPPSPASGGRWWKSSARSAPREQRRDGGPRHRSVVFPGRPGENLSRRHSGGARTPAGGGGQGRSGECGGRPDCGERDERDRGRAESPLVQAPDAIYIDSTGLAPGEVEEAILKVIRAQTFERKGF